jgi:transposase
MARTTTLQDRVTIDELAQAGYTDPQIAAEVGWKLSTVRKWRRRAQRQGRKGLASAMGRPTRVL